MGSRVAWQRAVQRACGSTIKHSRQRAGDIFCHLSRNTSPVPPRFARCWLIRSGGEAPHEYHTGRRLTGGALAERIGTAGTGAERTAVARLLAVGIDNAFANCGRADDQRKEWSPRNTRHQHQKMCQSLHSAKLAKVHGLRALHLLSYCGSPTVDEAAHQRKTGRAAALGAVLARTAPGIHISEVAAVVVCQTFGRCKQSYVKVRPRPTEDARDADQELWPAFSTCAREFLCTRNQPLSHSHSPSY